MSFTLLRGDLPHFQLVHHTFKLSKLNQSSLHSCSPHSQMSPTVNSSPLIHRSQQDLNKILLQLLVIHCVIHRGEDVDREKIWFEEDGNILHLILLLVKQGAPKTICQMWSRSIYMSWCGSICWTARSIAQMEVLFPTRQEQFRWVFFWFTGP